MNPLDPKFTALLVLRYTLAFTYRVHAHAGRIRVPCCNIRLQQYCRLQRALQYRPAASCRATAYVLDQFLGDRAAVVVDAMSINRLGGTEYGVDTERILRQSNGTWVVRV